MIIILPKQLQVPSFRFIRVRDNKAPLEKEWQISNNYPFSDAEEMLKKEKRYGIATGFGNLIVIDFDSRKIQEEVEPQLPSTFTVETAGKGLHHLYYIANSVPASFKVLDLNKETLADVQGVGKQVIGPGTEFNGRKYEVVKDVDIASIPYSKIRDVFSKWTDVEKEIKKFERADDECEIIKQKIKIKDILDMAGIDTSKNPTACPFHSSKGGRCFSYNDNVYHCFHCEQKGNIFHLVMALDKVDFVEAKKRLAKKAGVKLKNSFVSQKGFKIDSYVENVRSFHKINPFFYDLTGSFWVWDNFRFRLKDEIDLLNMIDDALGFNGATIMPSEERKYTVAFKRVGREKYYEVKPSPKRWVQFKDKAISIRSKRIYKVTPDYFFCNPIPWELGKTTATPVMDKLFEEWVGKKYVKTLYELFAYLTYTGYPIQLIFCFYGAGRNGKSQLLRVIEKFVGPENRTSTELDKLMSSKFEAFKLYKKLVCVMGETNFGKMKRTNLLKSLAGGDTIGFERKNKDPFDEYNYAKIIVSSNSLPISDDTSEGFYRRWFILDFKNEFPEGKDIVETIPDEEYNNLALKCTEILPRLLDRGVFSNQGDIEQRKKHYQIVSNPFPIFISACCEKSEMVYDSYGSVYTAYVHFLMKNKHRKVSRREFRDVCDAEGIYFERTSKEINGVWTSGNWLVGIKLKPNWETYI